MQKSLTLLILVSLLWACQQNKKSTTTSTSSTQKTENSAEDEKDITTKLSPEVASKLEKIKKAKEAAKNRKPQPSLVTIVKGLSKAGNFKPVSEDKWSPAYQPKKKSKRMLISKKEEEKNKWKGLVNGKTKDIELDVENVLSMVLKNKAGSDVKVTAFQFLDTEIASRQEKNIKAIGEYILSTKSTIKHPNTYWQQNYIIYFFETRSAGFQEDMTKLVAEFKQLASVE